MKIIDDIQLPIVTKALCPRCGEGSEADPLCPSCFLKSLREQADAERDRDEDDFNESFRGYERQETVRGNQRWLG